MKPLPIRIKFALWSGIAITLALGAFAAGTIFNLHQKQIREADREIETEWSELEALLPGKLPETIQWTLDPNLGWMVFDDKGQLLRSDPNLSESSARKVLSIEGILTTEVEGRTWRVKQFEAGANRTIVVGYDMKKAQVALTNLMVAYAWTLPLAIIVVVASSWWVTSQALTPFSHLIQAIEGIQSNHLERKQRLPVHPAKDEIQSLAISFNNLLSRIEKSFAQTKRFAADASHELRTPLTIMKAEVERVLAIPDIPEDTVNSLVSLQDEIARLDRITEQLLQLARFDAGQIVLEKNPVNYSELLTEACEDAELLAAAANIKLETQIQPDIHGLGDPNHLRRLLLNLLDNACKHNRSGGEAKCFLEKDGRGAVLRIGNTGPGIPPEKRERVFERFFLSDPSRSNSRGHGLGLALCWEIVELHGGQLSLSKSSGPDWTEFVVILPVEP